MLEYIGKNNDQGNAKRKHKFTLHDVQSGGYGEYIGLTEDEKKFLSINHAVESIMVGVGQNENPAMYKVGSQSIA